jgi:hypothetical protein
MTVGRFGAMPRLTDKNEDSNAPSPSGSLAVGDIAGTDHIAVRAT